MRRLAKPLKASSLPGVRIPPSPCARGLLRPARFRFFSLLSLLTLALTTAGCIERKLIIRTDPRDARVSLDGQQLEDDDGELGVFVEDVFFDGGHRLTVRRPGYRTQELLFDISGAWYTYPPMDLVAEVLVPWTIRDTYRINVSLEAVGPFKAKESEALIERGEAMAREAGAEFE